MAKCNFAVFAYFHIEEMLKCICGNGKNCEIKHREIKCHWFWLFF